MDHSHAKRKRSKSIAPSPAANIASCPSPEHASSTPHAFHKLQTFAFQPPNSISKQIPRQHPLQAQIGEKADADSIMGSSSSTLPPNSMSNKIRRQRPRQARIPPTKNGPGEEEEADADPMMGDIIPGACDALVSVARDLVASLEGLKFAPPVTCVYNPLVYAWNLHEQYIRKHGGRRVEVLLIGMNPGPFGMAQTGVPFGDSTIVHNFHGITGQVESPVSYHPKRPIYGMQCPRPEISGQRLWGWARDRFGSPAEFFKHFWVYNYCPLVFMEASGKNRTPDKLHPTERKSLETACNCALIKTISTLQPKFVIGIGKYAATRLQKCGITGVKIGDIIHPSPANPQANKDWFKKIEEQLTELGVRFT